MHASVWGPPLWKAIFSAAWHVDDETVDILREVLLELLPVLLPCVTCRENYRKHVPAVHRQSKSRLRSPDEVMRWCWYMKNEVNKVTHHNQENSKSFKHQDTPNKDMSRAFVCHNDFIQGV